MTAFLRITVAMLAALGLATAQKSTPKIVFVCEHGAAKSVMAAAEFERMAKERGLAFEIVSRGTDPDAVIAAAVRTGLKADGMDVGSAKPVKVSAKDLAGATRVVTFGPNLEQWLPKGTKVLDWSSTPAPSKDYLAARKHIVEQLEELFRQLH